MARTTNRVHALIAASILALTVAAQANGAINADETDFAADFSNSPVTATPITSPVADTIQTISGRSEQNYSDFLLVDSPGSIEITLVSPDDKALMLSIFQYDPVMGGQVGRFGIQNWILLPSISITAAHTIILPAGPTVIGVTPLGVDIADIYTNVYFPFNPNCTVEQTSSPYIYGAHYGEDINGSDGFYVLTFHNANSFAVPAPAALFPLLSMAATVARRRRNA